MLSRTLLRVLAAALIPITGSAFPDRGEFAKLYSNLMAEMPKLPVNWYQITLIDREDWEEDSTRYYRVSLHLQDKEGCLENVVRAQVAWRGQVPSYSWVYEPCAVHLARPQSFPSEVGRRSIKDWLVTDAYTYGLEPLEAEDSFVRVQGITEDFGSLARVAITYTRESDNRTCVIRSSCSSSDGNATLCSAPVFCEN
jgi:hypothetical protein